MFGAGERIDISAGLRWNSSPICIMSNQSRTAPALWRYGNYARDLIGY